MTMNEADTRANLIDPKLVAAGWGEVEHSYIRREVNITQGRIISGGKRSKPVISDYVLEYRGRKLAAVEAKKESLSYTEGVRQAKDYAERLQCRKGYATNGHQIYEVDLLTGKEQLIEKFPDPESLWQLTYSNAVPDFTNAWREAFGNIPFEVKGDWQPRYYQENAIHNALEAIAQGENRILLMLATGTGKTCIAFQTAWKLFKSRWSLNAQKNPALAKKRPRILFLADRNVLANQAFNDFSPFSEDALVRIAPGEVKKLGAVPKNASVFFTIFQTFMSGGKDDEGNETPYFGDYPQDFFDFIIIDECHRGGANDESSWRAILDYFSPAVQLGLTATPKRTNNADTYNYFGDPVYSHTLKEGINDGFLTPFNLETAVGREKDVHDIDVHGRFEKLMVTLLVMRAFSTSRCKECAYFRDPTAVSRFKVLPIVGTMDEYVYTPGDGIVIKGEPEAGRVYKEGDFGLAIFSVLVP